MSSGFVSETELADKRRIRQEEWEKVRQPNEPQELPEEPYDARSLFDRLEEQKQKKQQDFEEAHKLKNMIRGLDDDEVQFLDLIDQKKIEAEQLKEREEEKELLEFRKKVEELKTQSLDQRIQTEIRAAKQVNSVSSNSKSQQQLLKGVVVKRKSTGAAQSPINTKNPKLECGEEPAGEASRPSAGGGGEEVSPPLPPALANGEGDKESAEHTLKRKRPEDEESPKKIGLTCIGILPSLCSYAESSDESDHSCSSSSDIENDTTKYDLVGRKIIFKSKEEAGQGMSK